jgi:hypothetical protein
LRAGKTAVKYAGYYIFRLFWNGIVDGRSLSIDNADKRSEVTQAIPQINNQLTVKSRRASKLLILRDYMRHSACASRRTEISDPP